MLQCSRSHAYGYLGLIWEAAYQSGDEFIGDENDVEICAEWNGEKGLLVKALLECGSGGEGFIEKVENGYYVHDLYDHAPEYVKKRMERETERIKRGETISQVRRDAALKRWSKDKADMQTDASDIQLHANGMQTDANGSPPSPAPSPAPSPKRTLSLDYSEPFKKFWKIHPKSKEKDNTWNEWKKLKLDSQIDMIIEALEAQIENKAEGDRLDIFVPEFQDSKRWIKNKKWEDKLTSLQSHPAIPAQRAAFPSQT